MANYGVIAGTAGIQTGMNTASGIFGSLISGWQSRKNAKLQQKYNQQNMLLSHQYEQENMAKQQEYWQQQFDAQNAREDYLLQNQDALKVQSLRNAGLNPAFANGTQTLGQLGSPTPPSGGTSAGASAAMPSAPMPQMAPVDVANIKYMQEQGEAAYMSASAQLLKSFKDMDLSPYEALNYLGNFVNNMSSASYTQQLETTVSVLRPHQVNKYLSEIDLNKAESAYKNAVTTATLAKMPYEIKQTLASINLMQQQSLTEQSKRGNLAAQAAMFFASVEELASRAKMNAAMTNQVLISANNAVIQGDIFSLEKDLKTYQKEMYQEFTPEERANLEYWQTVLSMGTNVINSLGSAAMQFGIGGKAMGLFKGTLPRIGF